jgi:hypothetical protein
VQVCDSHKSIIPATTAGQTIRMKVWCHCEPDWGQSSGTVDNLSRL